MKLKKYLQETAKYLLRSYPVIRPYVKKVERLYQMTDEELHEYNEQRFLYIFRKAFDKSPFYHKLYTEAGITKADINCLEDIVKLPVVTKEMVKKNGLEMLTVSRHRVISGHTSGTTGTPLTIYENWPSIWWERAYGYYQEKLCGYTGGRRIVTIRGNLDKNILCLKVHLANTLFLSSYNISAQTAEIYYRKIVDFKPTAIKGYPSSLYALALALKDKGLECHIPVAFTSSETLYPHQRKLIEEMFHTQIYDHYGTTERTVSLDETLDHNGYYEQPGYGIEEYSDDYLITTSLINDTFPLIRYKTDDRIVLKEGAKKTKEGFIDRESIQKVDGRAATLLICKDGTSVSSAALSYVFKYANIRYAQFVQDKVGVVQLNIVPEDSYSSDSEKYIRDYLDKTLGVNNMDVTIKMVSESELQHTGRNKLQLVVSTLNNCNSVCCAGGGIKLISGRSDDSIICKDGSIVTRIDFVEKLKHIKACQWIQHKAGEVEVRIVPDEGFCDKDKISVVSVTAQRCGEGNMDVIPRLCTMDELEYSGRGKFRLIINKTK